MSKQMITTISLTLLPILLFSSNIPKSNSTPNYVFSICPSTSFPANSKYITNIHNLLNSLASKVTSNPVPFYSTSSGDNTRDVVYGLYLCRGDQNATGCTGCVVSAATNDVLNIYCPSSRVAMVWYDECMIRYSNESISGKMIDSPFEPILDAVTGRNYDGNQTLFKEAVMNTMNSMVNRTANDMTKYVTQVLNFTKSDTLYAMQQCTPDLAAKDCGQCLMTAISRLEIGKGLVLLQPSCQIRYEMFLFYNDAVNASFVTRPPTATTGTRRNKSTSVNTVHSTPIVQHDHTAQSDNQLVLSHTPKGSEQWIRVVESKFTPTVGTIFPSLEAGIEFYNVYARACGFTPRLYTAKTIRGGTTYQKFIVCNRQGFRGNKQRLRYDTVNDDSNGESVKRKVKITRIGCKAALRFALVAGLTGPAIIDEFRQCHNHRLTSVSNRDLEKLSRSLDIFQKQLILDNSKLNIGAAKTFAMCKEFAKGYENIGATVTDFKNFQRDIKCYIGQRDADLFLSRLQKLQATGKGFYFAYQADASNCLSRVFWADSIAVRNYSRFGDAVSFDPTYGTNKYSMVFTPFTGVDHHRKSIFFGACLLTDESEDSFTWTFQQFMNAMGHKEPQFIITDQCLGIKNAVPAVFKNARHRYCMWHITEKVTDKVGSALCKDTDFLSRFNSVVWDSDLDPSEFEEKWHLLISDFNLQDNKWLKTMFEERHRWIPAYHRDILMGCILRTTQRSESANSFFKRYENHFGTLVEFWMRFETAMDQQRYNQRCADHDSDSSFPVTETKIRLEKHAAAVYTHSVFYVFQEEIKSSITCGVSDFAKEGDVRIIGVEDAETNKTYQVKFNLSTTDATCTCKLFERTGLLCRHIIWAYTGKGINQIPSKYILGRWTKNSHSPDRFDSNGNIIEDSDLAHSGKTNLWKLWAEFNATVNVLNTLEDDHMDELATVLVQFREKFSLNAPQLTKEQEIEMLLGCTASSEITVLPPIKAHNKGSGKRLTSAKEQSIAKAAKPKRLCAYCNKKSDHDKRTCPLRIADEAAAKSTTTKK